MTKLLHVTDFHANRRWFNWVLDHAEDYDLIAYTGDFLDNFGDESLGSQVGWITAWARSLSRPLLVCPGNNDVEADAPPVSSGRWLNGLPNTKSNRANSAAMSRKPGEHSIVPPDTLTDWAEKDAAPPSRVASVQQPANRGRQYNFLG
jgi:predicted phosphodiesterase